MLKKQCTKVLRLHSWIPLPGCVARTTGLFQARVSLLVSFVLFVSVFLLADLSLAAEISVVNTRLNNNELFIAATVRPDPKFTENMDEGMTKEFVFYIDLFRVWNVWPDEFVTGRKLVKILKSDPIKREHIATSVDGNVSIEKRFKDTEAMINWAMSIPELKFTNVKELEPGVYYVRITVESHVRKLPPVIGHLLFFVKEKDSIFRNSATFQLNSK